MREMAKKDRTPKIDIDAFALDQAEKLMDLVRDFFSKSGKLELYGLVCVERSGKGAVERVEPSASQPPPALVFLDSVMRVAELNRARAAMVCFAVNEGPIPIAMVLLQTRKAGQQLWTARIDRNEPTPAAAMGPWVKADTFSALPSLLPPVSGN